MRCDGWTSAVKEDWMEVTKGLVKDQTWFTAVKGGRVLFIDGNPFSWTGK